MVLLRSMFYGLLEHFSFSNHWFHGKFFFQGIYVVGGHAILLFNFLFTSSFCQHILLLIKIVKIQMAYLDEWDSLETDHINSLSGALLDLEASTLRVPVTSGATVCFIKVFQIWNIQLLNEFRPLRFVHLQADVDQLKGAICSALDVMQVMATSIGSLLSQVRF